MIAIEQIHAQTQRRARTQMRTPSSRRKRIGLEGRALSQRQVEVMRLVVQGLTRRQIAQRLGISYYTAHEHIRTIYLKLGVANKAEAVAKALSQGLMFNGAPRRGWICPCCGCPDNGALRSGSFVEHV